MKADERFLKQQKSFWAHVRTISELLGYTHKGQEKIKIPTASEVKTAFERIGLASSYIIRDDGNLEEYGRLLFDYFEYRAGILNDYVRPRLMKVEDAKKLFEELQMQYTPKCSLPMNKQKGDKKNHAFFTCIINTLIEANAEGLPCNYDPHKLTAFTQNGMPLRTLARRVDGAFTTTVNPIAIWEIKEYYYTTTFGSRVADGVYETLLDGMEIEELQEHEQVEVKHYLMLDDYNTWWNSGRSYLCRIVDMLHMGYIDEVLFGKEVVERLPTLVKEWVEIAKSRNNI